MIGQATQRIWLVFRMVGRRRDAREELARWAPGTYLPWPLPDQQTISVEVPGSAASPWPGPIERSVLPKRGAQR
ncbi:MAG: hypothetical protein K0R61_5195 [Microvirga sp.]|jgi:hypothetical protein|nr:hypothetical protein [Microvirga sp.]